MCVRPRPWHPPPVGREVAQNQQLATAVHTGNRHQLLQSWLAHVFTSCQARTCRLPRMTACADATPARSYACLQQAGVRREVVSTGLQGKTPAPSRPGRRCLSCSMPSSLFPPAPCPHLSRMPPST